MNSDIYFNKIFLEDKTLTEEGRNIVVNDIISLQEHIKHTKKRITKEELENVNDVDLVLLLCIGHEYFAIRYFMECSRNIPKVE